MPVWEVQLYQILKKKAPILRPGPKLPGRATIAGRWSGRGCVRRFEDEAKSVDAIAQSCWLRAVIKDMAEMAAAAAAMHLNPSHAVGTVLGAAQRIVERLPEARPAGAAVEFGIGREQRQVATGAGKGALAMLFQKRARPRPFGAVLAQNLVLLRRQLRAPFGVGLLDLEFLGGFGRLGAQPAEAEQAKEAGD